jgi:hypothetical protein
MTDLYTQTGEERIRVKKKKKKASSKNLLLSNEEAVNIIFQ